MWPPHAAALPPHAADLPPAAQPLPLPNQPLPQAAQLLPPVAPPAPPAPSAAQAPRAPRAPQAAPRAPGVPPAPEAPRIPAARWRHHSTSPHDGPAMSKIRPVAGGGRAVEVAPERLAGWFARFADRHDGIATTRTTPSQVLVTAHDGTTAEVTTPFEDFAPTNEAEGLDITPLLSHATKSRRLGLLLVRLGGHSIGVALDGEVLVSTTDNRQVHGRNKAGGWSQQRFARRRQGQARVALQAAADDAARVLLPRLDELDAVVLGGDKQALDALRTDRRLTPVFARASTRILDVPEPRRSVLDDAAERARATEIIIRDPDPDFGLPQPLEAPHPTSSPPRTARRNPHPPQPS